VNRIIFFVGIMIFLMSCNMKNFTKTETKDVQLNVIPKPLMSEVSDKNFKINKSVKIAVSVENTEALNIARNFAAKYNLSVESGTVDNVNRISFSLSADSMKYGREGYSLDISEDGMFYAVQTIYQISESNDADGSKYSIPCVKILDKPEFVWRGDMLDVSRHFLPVSLNKKNLDYLARYKMNTFHWHLTDDQGWRVQVDSFPNLTKTGAWRVDHNDEPWWGRAPQQPGEKADYGGYYTKDEIREIVEYAEKRFITIVPEIDMPGHSQAIIASYPEVSCDSGSYYVATGGVAEKNTVCPGKEASFKFIEGMLSEVLQLFPGEYFHIGGDECNKSMWEKCPDCQARIKNEGLKDEHELQSYFIQRVEKIVNKLGKKLIGWDEILEGGLAENAAVMSWRGEDGGIKAAEMNHYVVMTPSQYCYLDLKQGDPELEPELGYSECKLSTCYSYNPVPDILSKDKTEYILGLQGNLWGESIQNEDNANYMLFPRLQAIAEVGWTPAAERSWSDFIQRLKADMKWMEREEIGFAKSLYNAAVNITKAENGLAVRLSTEHGSLPIYYTLDGSVPSAASNSYKKPLNISESLTIKAAAIRDGEILGKVKTKKFQIHKAFGKPVKLGSLPSEKYKGIENISLTDLMRGSVEISDNQWMGFEDTDFEAIIDLGEMTAVESAALGCLENQGKWVFLPGFVEVYVSDDGKNYTRAAGINIDNGKNNNEPSVKNIDIKFKPLKTRFIKIFAKNMGRCPDWHKGAGGKAWLFIDEVIIE